MLIMQKIDTAELYNQGKNGIERPISGAGHGLRSFPGSKPAISDLNTSVRSSHNWVNELALER